MIYNKVSIMGKQAEHRRKVFTFSDRIKVSPGSEFKVSTENSIVLYNAKGEEDVSLQYEHSSVDEEGLSNLICYLLNREISILSREESADLSDLLP